MSTPAIIKNIHINLPRDAILKRLSYSKAHSELSECLSMQLDAMMINAFNICKPAAVWNRFKITEKSYDSVILETNDKLKSASLMRDVLKNASHVLLMAVTIGDEITAVIQSEMFKNPLLAMVYDAVGSEVTEAAMQYLHDRLRAEVRRFGEQVTKFRFSPGYGDFPLNYQNFFFRVLSLENISVALTDSFQLIPEKSATAIAGIIVVSK